MLIASAFYVFVVLELDQPSFVKIGMCIAATYLGMHLPLLFLKNRIARSGSCRSTAPSPTRSTCC